MADPASPYPYAGSESLRLPIERVLRGVVDPELALSIVDVGQVYGVTVSEQALHVRLTMTSAACPVTDVIVDEIQAGLEPLVPPQMALNIEVVWEPAWSPERMSERARKFMGW